MEPKVYFGEGRGRGGDIGPSSGWGVSASPPRSAAGTRAKAGARGPPAQGDGSGVGGEAELGGGGGEEDGAGVAGGAGGCPPTPARRPPPRILSDLLFGGAWESLGVVGPWGWEGLGGGGLPLGG